MKRLIAYAVLVLVAAVVVLTPARRATIQAQVAGPSEALREQYIETLKTKAGLMSDEEVQKALETANAEIRALQANQKLDQTAETLRSIEQEFKGTPAADEAKSMLKAYAIDEGDFKPVGQPVPTRSNVGGRF